MMSNKSLASYKLLITLIFVLLGLALILPTIAFAGVNQWTSNGPEGDDINVVAVSPNYASDNTVFIGTNGTGIFKSTNGGQNWSQVNTGLTNTQIWSVATSPNYASDKTVFAGSWGGGIYKSTDGGGSWSQVNTGLTDNFVWSVAVSPNYASDNTVFAGTWNNLYKSTDGGTTWSQVTGLTGSYFSVAVSPNYASDNTVFAGSWGGGIYKSTDGGVTWIRVISALTGAYVSIAVSPNYASDNTVFAGTYGGAVYKSTDGGVTWSQSGLTSAFIRSVTVSPNYASDNTVFVGVWGGVYRSTNGGQNWSQVNTGLIFTGVKSVAVSPNYASDKTVFAGAYGSVYKSTDGGQNWTSINGGLNNSNVLTAAVSPNYAQDNTLFAATTLQGVYKSTDGGGSWSQVTALTSSVYSIALSPNYASDSTVFIGTAGGRVYKSTDGGGSWSQVSISNPVYTVAVSPNYASDNTVFIGTSAGVYKSTDGGQNWTLTSLINQVVSLALSPNYASDKTVFAGTSANYIFKSTDGGSSWTQLLQGLPKAAVNSIALSPNYASDKTLFAGIYGSGVYKSTNGGQSWSQVNSGLTNLNINAVAISPNYASDKTVFAATWGGGVYMSTNEGQSWSQVNSGLPTLNVSLVLTSPNYSSDNTIFAGHANGVFSYTFADTTPPTTSLSTNPSAPDGNNGWFKTTPTITLTRDETGTTYYQWDSTSTANWLTYSTPFSGQEGWHTLYYFSVDSANNTETIKSQVFKVDTQPPASFTLNTPADGSTINRPYPYLSWNDSTDTGSGLAKYQLYIDGSLSRDNVVNWTATTPSTALSNGSHSWFVRALDVAGNYKDSVIRNLTINAGAGKIAFTSNRGAYSEIYLMNADGSNEIRLTYESLSGDFAADPAFSADGSKIVYVSTGHTPVKNRELYIMNADGTNQTQLTNNPADDCEPSFSPDGSKIVFRSDRDNFAYEIYLMNVDGSSLVRLTNNSVGDDGPVFSPDGSKIAFASNRNGNQDIYLMNIDGTNVTRLTTDTANDWSPAFSPDGSKIVFLSDRDRDSQTLETDPEIYIMNVDGTGQTRLTSNTDFEDSPSFSPDGNKIAFSRHSPFPGGARGIYVMNSNGTGQTRLTCNIDIFPSWGPGLPVSVPPPSTPTIVGFATSSTQIDLYWPAATSNVGIAGYKIYNGDTGLQIATTTATSYSFTGLSAGNFYSYYVKAYDVAGNLSAASNVVRIDPGRGGTTPAGPGVAPEIVTPTSDISLTFTDVTSDGTTTVTQQAITTDTPPSGFKFIGNQIDISTTANYTPPVTIAIRYNPNLVSGDEASLRLFHWEGGQWVDVTVLVDTVNDIIIGRVNSLSPFVLGEPLPAKTATTLTYLGPQLVQYSDKTYIEVKLSDEQGQGIPNKEISIECKELNETWTSITSDLGIASHEFRATRGVSLYNISASFAGDALYLGSSCVGTFEEVQENASLQYTGDVIVPITQTFTLKAQITGEDDGYSGDLSKLDPAKVKFYLTDSVNGEVTIISATTFTLISAGAQNGTPGYPEKAEFSVSTNIPVGVYKIVVKLESNDYYVAPDSEAVLGVSYDPSGGFATGGGWFTPDSESTLPGGRANFGFVTKYIKGSAAGNLEFQYKNANINLKSKTIDWLVISGTSVIFQGTATVNGSGVYTFRVLAKDNGEPGAGSDYFKITIWEGTDTESDPYHKAKNTLDGGNIVIHKKS